MHVGPCKYRRILFQLCVYAYVYKGCHCGRIPFVTYLQILHLVMSHDKRNMIMYGSMVMHHKSAIYAESLPTITITTVYTFNII